MEWREVSAADEAHQRIPVEEQVRDRARVDARILRRSGAELLEERRERPRAVGGCHRRRVGNRRRRGVNVSAGITYFNKEQFEELLCWMQLPALIAFADRSFTDLKPLQNLEPGIVAARDAAREAGYILAQFLGGLLKKAGRG